MSFLEQLSRFSILTRPTSKLGKVLKEVHPYSSSDKNSYDEILRRLGPVFDSLDKLFQRTRNGYDDKEIIELSAKYTFLKEKLNTKKTPLPEKNKYLLEFKNLIHGTNILNQFYDLLQSEKVQAFNINRQRHPTIQLFFDGLNFKGKNLQNIVFRNAKIIDSNLCEIDLTDSDCIETVFSKSALYKLNFTESQLNSATFTKVNGSNINFTDSNLPKAKFENCELFKANFCGANLSNVEIKDSSLYEANFSKADLSQAQINKLKSHNSNFERAIFKNTNLSNSFLFDANFKNAELTSTEFNNVDLTGADFSGAKLLKVNFYHCNLTGANFRNCDLYRITNQQLDQIINPLSVRNVNFQEGIKWLFKNIDSKELSNITTHKIIRFLNIDSNLVSRIDPTLLSKINTINPKEFIARLFLIYEINILIERVYRENHKTLDQLCRVLYNSCGNNLDDLILEGKLLSNHLSSGNESILRDSLELVFDTFVLPRLEKFLDTAAIKKLKQWQVSSFKEKLMPYFMIAISQNRFFDPSSDYSKLKGEVASLPKSANYKMPSLLLNLSRGIHHPVIAYDTAVRHILPEGSWYPILISANNQVEITLPNTDKKYLVRNLINYKDFDYETFVLGHCIGRGVFYVNKAKEGGHHYFSIREAETGIPISTVEFALNERLQLQKMQHKGKNNLPPSDAAKKILEIFLRGVKDGTYPLSLKQTGKDSSVEKLSVFENAVGTFCDDDTEVTKNRRIFDTTNVHSVQVRAWIKLAQPKNGYLINRLQNGETYKLNPGIGTTNNLGETIQLGGYRAKPEGIPYDNYFIPNSCRGDLSLESINPRKVNDKRLRFSQFSGNDLAEIDKGIERFFNTKVTDQMSFDDLIKSTIIEVVQTEEPPL